MTTSPALPSASINRLFGRLAALYGRKWLDLWAAISMPQVVATWADTLAGCSGEQIARALEHLAHHNPFPPTEPEFVLLCADFRPPSPPVASLPAPERPMGEFTRGIASNAPKGDKRDWAREILALQAKGEYRHVYGIECAREALRMPQGDA